MKKIAIIGCGNIGARHLQSCLNLDALSYKIYIVEPSDKMKNKGIQLLKDVNSSMDVVWLRDISLMPQNIDYAIIATSSNVRLKLVEALLAQCKVEHLILEKFLFQDVESYHSVSKILGPVSTKTYVNCPTRVWPLFQKMKDEVRKRQIQSIKVDIVGADIGCNGIHYLDLISFLIGSDDVKQKSFQLYEVMPSKREDYIQLSGDFSGIIGNVPFEINCPIGEFSGFNLTIEFADGEKLNCIENVPNLKVTATFDTELTQEEWFGPYQSMLTEGYISSLRNLDKCDLPDYETSKKLHLALLEVFLNELNKQNLLQNPDVCPIT